MLIGEHSRIWSASSVTIGNGVLVSHNCNIIDTNSHELHYQERVDSYKKMLKEGHPKLKPNVESKPIIIEDYAWINFNSVILKGIKIGTGAIIAPCSLVTKDVEPFSLVAGNPAKQIKRYDFK